MIKLLTNEATPGGSVSEFTWSTSEQVYPFEKAADGSTLYAKQVAVGAMPNTGMKQVSLGSIDCTKVARYWGTVQMGAGQMCVLPYVDSTHTMNHHIQMLLQTSNIYINTGVDYSSWTNGIVYLIYGK